MPSVSIAPSILAADFGALRDAVVQAEAAGADAIHVDVMDGHLVPEIAFGRRFVEALKRTTTLPLDVHLMVSNPQRHIVPFANAGASTVTIHAETVGEDGSAPLEEVLSSIRSAGVRSGVALKPATPATRLDDVWPLLDQVLVMTVEPGYSGQPFLPDMLPKIRQVASAAHQCVARDGKPVVIAVDGGIDEQTAPLCVGAGATFLVAGSSVFSSQRTVEAGMRALRRSVNQAQK
ncbi:MAG TPA: ribulose-phosphate 3-epimerase [Chloroflexota bacterium]|nr:ribulose-phosphate 3-epimerase [Chloroflexota bacterium]